MRLSFLILIVIGVFSFSFWLDAKEKAQAQKKQMTEEQQRFFSLKQKLFEDMQLFEKTFQDDADFLEVQKEIQRILQEQMQMGNTLRPRGFGNAFDHDFFEEVAPQSGGNIEWLENDKARILKVKMKMPADQPLDIKIAKNMINISGTIKSANGTSQFHQVVSVPSDCDGAKARIETDKEGYAQIILPKRFASSFKDQTKPTSTPKSEEERQPVSPTQQGLSI